MDADIGQFTPEQADLLHKMREVRMVDPTTLEVYVVVPNDAYLQLKRTLDQCEAVIKERTELFEERKEQDWWLVEGESFLKKRMLRNHDPTW
jgi:hypothetical protein